MNTENVLKFLTLIPFFLAYGLFFMQFFLQILSGMANSLDPDQTAHLRLIWVCTVCICLFFIHFDV